MCTCPVKMAIPRWVVCIRAMSIENHFSNVLVVKIDMFDEMWDNISFNQKGIIGVPIAGTIPTAPPQGFLKLTGAVLKYRPIDLFFRNV